MDGTFRAQGSPALNGKGNDMNPKAKMNFECLVQSLVGPKLLLPHSDQAVDSGLAFPPGPDNSLPRYLALYFCELDEVSTLEATVRNDAEEEDGSDVNEEDEDFVQVLRRRYRQRLKPRLGVELVMVTRSAESEDDDGEDEGESEGTDEHMNGTNDDAGVNDSEENDDKSDEIDSFHRIRHSLPWPCVVVGAAAAEEDEGIQASFKLEGKLKYRNMRRERRHHHSYWRRSNRLFHRYRIISTPALVLIDATTGEILHRDCVDHIREDPACERFPWGCGDIHAALNLGSEAYLTNKLNKPPLRWSQGITRRFVGLLFSAGWCSTETHCVDLVSRAYFQLETRIDYDCDGLDVIFVSVGGHDDSAFNDLFTRRMPPSWFAVDPQQQQHVIRDWQSRFAVSDYPCLVVIDMAERRVVNPNAIGMLENETLAGELFPWTIPEVRRLSASSPPALLDSLDSGDDDNTVLFLFTDDEDNAKIAEGFATQLIVDWRGPGPNRLEGAHLVSVCVGDVKTPFIRQLRRKLSLTEEEEQDSRLFRRPFAVATIDFASGAFSIAQLDSLEDLLDRKLLRTMVEAWLDGDLEPFLLREVDRQPGNCPGSHGLRVLSTRTANYRCDVCGESQPAATEMFSCRTCNYDECFGCHERALRDLAGDDDAYNDE